jgi:hypothetical protein
MLNQMKKEKNKEKKPKPNIKGHHGSFCKSIPRSRKSMNKKKSREISTSDSKS